MVWNSVRVDVKLVRTGLLKGSEANRRSFCQKLPHFHSRWLGPHCQQDVSDLLTARQARLGDRLKKLEVLIMDVYEPAGPKALAEFSAWFENVHQARALRNDYAHGRWGVPGKYNFKPPGRLIDAEPLLVFVPLQWDMSPDHFDDSVSLTIEEFAAQVHDAESLFNAYWQLCQRYIAHAKTRRPFEPV